MSDKAFLIFLSLLKILGAQASISSEEVWPLKSHLSEIPAHRSNLLPYHVPLCSLFPASVFVWFSNTAHSHQPLHLSHLTSPATLWASLGLALFHPSHYDSSVTSSGAGPWFLAMIGAPFRPGSSLFSSFAALIIIIFCYLCEAHFGGWGPPDLQIPALRYKVTIPCPVPQRLGI